MTAPNRQLFRGGCGWAAALLLALLAPWGAVLAVPPSPDSPGSAQPAETGHDGSVEVEEDTSWVRALLARIEEDWWRRDQALRQGDVTRAREIEEALLSFLAAEDIARAQPFAEAALVEAREAAPGDPATAVLQLRFAARLDPRLAAVPWEEGKIRLGGHQFRWDTVRAFARAVRLRFASWWNRYADLFLLGTSLYLGLLVAGALLVLLLLLRAGPLLVHEIEERLPAGWHPLWKSAIGWTLLLAPLGIQVLGAFALLAWAVVLAAVVGRAERRLLAGWLLVLALAVPASGLAWLLEGVAASPAARVAVASAEKAIRPDLIAELARLAELHPGDATWKTLLARLVASRHPEQAVRLLRQAAALAPGDARIRVLLGNVLFRVGKIHAAGVAYREALAIDPADPLAHVNLARVYLADFDFDRAEQEMAAARKLDPDLVDRLDKENPDGVTDPEITVSEVARQVLADEVVPGLRRVLRPDNPLTIAALAAFFLSIVVALRGRRLTARTCRRCGRVFCRRCAGSEALEQETCIPCQRLFREQEGLSPEARREQAARIDAWIRTRRRRNLLGRILWPGTGLLLDGRATPGFLLAWAWATLVLGTILAPRLVPLDACLVPWRPGIPWAAATVLFWIATQHRAFQPEDPAQRSRRR